MLQIQLQVAQKNGRKEQASDFYVRQEEVEFFYPGEESNEGTKE